MIGKQEMTTGGIFYFKPSECTCCRLDTAGNHEWNCPCNPNTLIINNTINIEMGHPLGYNFRNTDETIS